MSAAAGATVPYDRLKRMLDIAGAAGLLILTAPVQAAVAVLVRVSLGSPVLFRQARPGRRGVVFTLQKFRTMKEPDSARGLISDEERLTRVGRALRAASLDELPTLWNVLRGDMSVVGPRPLLVKYLDRYSPDQARRHEVRPGLTGLAQVSGRNALGWPERLRLDVEYVDTRCLALDAQILLRTVHVVLTRRGISHADHVTMHEFEGAADGR